MTSTKQPADETTCKAPKVIPLSTDAFTQPVIPHVSSFSSITTSTSSTTNNSTTTTSTMSNSNSDSNLFNISVQSPGGTPTPATTFDTSVVPTTTANNNNHSNTSSYKKVSFRDSSEEDEEYDEEYDDEEEEDHDIDIVLAHKKDINRLNVLKNKISQSPIYFTRYLVETYPSMIQHNQLNDLVIDSLPGVRNIWKNQQCGFISEMCGTVYNEFKAKQLFLSRSYKKASSSSSSNNDSPNNVDNLNYCKQYYFYTPYENYILPYVDCGGDSSTSSSNSSSSKVVNRNNKDPNFPPTTKQSPRATVDEQQTREKNSSSPPSTTLTSGVALALDLQQSALNIAVTNHKVVTDIKDQGAMEQNIKEEEVKNTASVEAVVISSNNETIAAQDKLIKEDDSNEIKLEIPPHIQQDNCTENNNQKPRVENNSEYQHRRALSDTATLWSSASLNLDEPQGFKTPTKKITLTNRFDSTDDISSGVPSTVERDTDILASNRDGDIRFMIDPSASPFVPISPLVPSNAFSPRSVPVTSSAFQELENQGLSPVSPRLLRSGSVVALDKKTPNLQSPLKKKAHRRVKSFNLTHAAGVFGSEFDIKCVKVELIMMDIDIYLTKFEPIRIMSDRWLRDLDFIKFGVKIFNRIYVWLEDSLVHQFSTDKIDLSDCPTIEFNLSEQPLSKVLDTTCQIINEYNTKQKYSYYNYHSFSFARRVIEKLSGKKLKSKNVLPKTLVKHYREYRDAEKKKREKEEKEEKEHSKASSSTSPATPNDGKEVDVEFGDDTTPTCKENSPLTPEDYLDLLIEEERNRDTNFIYYVPKRLILKKYRKFHQKQEIKNHTYLLNLINSLLEQCPKFKEEYKFDYLILKTLDRKFWLEKYLQEKYDPVKQKFKFFHKEGTKIHFEEPLYLRDLLKERIHRRRKMFNVKIEDEQLAVEESPYWKNDNDNIVTNFSKHREEKKGKTVKVLSMDGGGMKGLILIEILKVIEERVGKKICEIFDIVAGTSTGGIVALLINGGIPMKQAKEFYIDIGKNIFDLKTTHNKSLVKTMKVLRGRSWYDGYHLEMTSMNLTQDVDLNTLHKKKPFTFLVSTMDKSSNAKMNLDEPTAFVFRTYSDPYDYVEEGEASSLSSSSKKQPSFYRGTTTGAGITAMDVIRATSAAPMYFKPRIIGDSEFIDGAVVANNPIQLSMYEAKQIFPNHDKFVFVSLGTGALSGKNSEEDGDEEVNFNNSPQGHNTKPRKKSIMKAFKGISQTLNTLLSVVNLQLSSDRIHKMATAQLEFFKEGKSLCEYFRLNVPGLGDKGLDEVDDELFALFEKDTVAYMENHPDLDRLCQLLKMD